MTNDNQKFPVDDKGDNGGGGMVASCHLTSLQQH